MIYYNAKALQIDSREKLFPSEEHATPAGPNKILFVFHN